VPDRTGDEPATDEPATDEPATDEPRQTGDLRPTAFMEAMGGGRGLVDSALPATVFVLVRLVDHRLGVAIACALASGVLLLALRLRRGEPLQQVGSGFFGLVLAVVVARATGTGKGFFLPGILTTALTGLGFVVSLAVRRPAVGLALAAYDGKYAGWRDHPGLRRACQIATALVGKQRFEKVTSAGLPGRSAWARLENTLAGCWRYWMDTHMHAASMLTGGSGRVGSALRSWVNQRSNRGFAASSAAFMPWPITSA